ncbi:hypothetical protein [Nitrospira sp. BLG_1]|uniref:hypothetical protein n=1 Tax=Nitrospira sp. BLG_1 TaxID=3395883 RepID=UPI0039BC2FAA
MIIDRIQLAGNDAYFRTDNGINLAGLTARTGSLRKGKQLEILGIELLIESDGDLTGLFNRQNASLIEVRVMKEMFPALFNDPFRHRVHTIAGFNDFERGTAKNCKAMDVDGIPTIVSTGTETCVWTSPRFRMPEDIHIEHASWELAASRKTPRDNFTYTITLNTFDGDGNPRDSVELAPGLDPTQPRKREELGLSNVASYELQFKADVRKDAAMYEKHTVMVGASIGTPLLRAINLLEPVAKGNSVYEIYSLSELLSQCSDHQLIEMDGWPIIQGRQLRKINATLNLSATLVQSDQEDTPNGRYESIEIAVAANAFTHVETRLVGEVLMRVKD